MKSKILFIVSDFYHGGAQREMFELDNVIDKNKVEVNILCLSNLKSSKDFSDFFYQKHLDLNTQIYFLDDLLKIRKKTLFKRLLKRLLITSKKKYYAQKKITKFLDLFKKVFFMGEYVYAGLEGLLKPNYFEEIIIFIMSARFQGEHYRSFSKNNKYLFISSFDKIEEVNYEFEGFTNYCHIPLLLSLEVSNMHYNTAVQKLNKVKKIGIFTRLNKSKPLDPFFYALHLLLMDEPDIELHIFGSGDYKKAGYNRYIEHLDLGKNVFFRGHQEDIKISIKNENLNLVWFQGYNNKPAGYAGLDVCLTGTPMLLWDFFVGDNVKINKLTEVYPHFKNVSYFVKASKRVLKNEDLAKLIAHKQFENVSRERDLNQNIKLINHLLYNE